MYDLRGAAIVWPACCLAGNAAVKKLKNRQRRKQVCKKEHQVRLCTPQKALGDGRHGTHMPALEARRRRATPKFEGTWKIRTPIGGGKFGFDAARMTKRVTPDEIRVIIPSRQREMTNREIETCLICFQ